MEGKEEHEVVQEVYLGESSRSVVSRARKHYRDNKVAMKKEHTQLLQHHRRQGGGQGGGGGQQLDGRPCHLTQWRRHISTPN